MRTKVFILGLISILFLNCESVEETIDPCSTDKCIIIDSVNKHYLPNNIDVRYEVKARRTCNNGPIIFETTGYGVYEIGETYCDLGFF